MKFAITTDSSGYSYITELGSEINKIEEFIEKKYSKSSVSIGIVLRCLPDKYNRKTFRKFDKTANALSLDITVSRDKYIQLTKNEQREDLGSVFFYYLKDSLVKYKNNLHTIDIDKFLDDIKKWCIANGWLEGKVSKARNLLNQDLPIEKVSDLSGLSINEVIDLYTKYYN